MSQNNDATSGINEADYFPDDSDLESTTNDEETHDDLDASARDEKYLEVLAQNKRLLARVNKLEGKRQVPKEDSIDTAVDAKFEKRDFYDEYPEAKEFSSEIEELVRKGISRRQAFIATAAESSPEILADIIPTKSSGSSISTPGKARSSPASTYDDFSEENVMRLVREGKIQF